MYCCRAYFSLCFIFLIFFHSTTQHLLPCEFFFFFFTIKKHLFTLLTYLNSNYFLEQSSSTLAGEKLTELATLKGTLVAI